ncbi:MAG: hypothetical protein ABFC71_10440 [Methanoregula sp.]
MKKYYVIFSIFLIFLMAAGVDAATGSSTSSSTSTSTVSSSTTLSADQAISSVYISSVTLDPQTFYPYERGTITVQLTNSGTQSVALTSADIIDNHIIVDDSNPYNTMLYLGPGNTMSYTFVVTAKPPDGTYFPLFTVASRDSGSIRYPIQVDVDSTDIRATISQKPDNFAVSTRSTVNLSLINPRNGDISNIIITPEGDGVTVSPAQYFLKTLDAGSSADIPFAITPDKATNVTFHITYQNGQKNQHTRDVVLPLNIGEDKTAAVPIINNVEIVNQGASYQLTGDVSNAGITDANAMILSLGAPAKGVEPYSNYAIGSLAADDFSSFTLDFTTTDLSSVPVLIQWKDADGNTFSRTITFDLKSSYGAAIARTGSSGSSGTSTSVGTLSAAGGNTRGGGGLFGIGGSRSGGISSFYPVIAGAIIIIAGIVLWKKRKWIASKIKKQ